ncbi:efflux RND transporter periplasmic adaptor subunit [Fusobacterium perfoetens]|uniref:efflux RND transporter periplasmic adaptor subunit n=1 Tax=Fusobacterium perfoetens TaxID=852 RepID=UPI0004833F1C|nr:efflux RND transporter periplasmic adaptor subunit [Fusobacterium perfoetens]
MNKQLRIITVISLILILLGGGIFISKNKKNNKNEIIYPTRIISTNNKRGYINVEGKIEANDTKKIFVDKKLKVDEVFIQEGDYVEKGQILMTFDETERNNIIRNLKREELSLAKIKRNLEVEKELLKLGGSSVNYIKELEEEIQRYQINIEEYQEDLLKTAERIISPVSGTVTSLLAQENYSVNTDEPLMEIADLSNIKIVLEVAEYDIKDIYLGQNLEIKPEAFEKKLSFKGKVTKISKISKPSSTTSENIVEVEVTPLEEIPNIIPGFKVSAKIFLEKNDDITISKNALLEDNNQYYVYIVDSNNTIIRRDVEIENIKGDSIIIKSGLKIGDEILTTPSLTLKPNDKIFKKTLNKIENKGEKLDNTNK